MPKGIPWGDTSQLAGMPIGCGAPWATTPQRLQPRCTVCSESLTRQSPACRPLSGISRARGSLGGSQRPRPGGRPEPSSCVESSHLSRLGEAIPEASSRQQPGPHIPSCAWRPLSDPRLHGEGGSLGEMSAGDSAAPDGQHRTAPTTVSNLCVSLPVRTGAPAAGPSSASAVLVSVGHAARRSSLRRSLTLRMPGLCPDAQWREHLALTGAARPEEV